MRKFSKKIWLGFLLLLTVVAFIIGCGCDKGSGDVILEWNNTRQEIDGFGVSQAYWSYAIYDLEDSVRNEVMELLFSRENGIGVSIFRGEIFPGYHPAPGLYDFNVPDLNPEEYNNVMPRPGQAWLMQQVQDMGVDKIVATTWSPPAWMKTNNQTNHGGYLKEEHYSDFAQLLAEFVKEYKRLHNVDIYAVSMSNEPNSMTFLPWNSCQWNSKGVKEFLANHVKPVFENEGLQDTKIIAAEPSWWSERLMRRALNDPVACSRLDIVGAHSYPIPIVNIYFPVNPFKTAVSKGKKVWMTESSDVGTADPGIESGIKWAKKIHVFMTRAEVNAWLYWLGAVPSEDDEALIYVDHETNTYTLTKRYYTFGHFSWFVRPGYVRIMATENPVPGVYLSSYKDNESGEFVIIAVNDSDAPKEIRIFPSGFTSQKLTPYVTNETLDMAKAEDIKPEDGLFEVALPSNSVTTYVGKKDSDFQ